MPTVYHCSPTNSTTFTTCCDVAIINEGSCPRCGKEVFPKGAQARFRFAHASRLAVLRRRKIRSRKGGQGDE